MRRTHRRSIECRGVREPGRGSMRARPDRAPSPPFPVRVPAERLDRRLATEREGGEALSQLRVRRRGIALAQPGVHSRYGPPRCRRPCATNGARGTRHRETTHGDQGRATAGPPRRPAARPACASGPRAVSFHPAITDRSCLLAEHPARRGRPGFRNCRLSCKHSCREPSTRPLRSARERRGPTS